MEKIYKAPAQVYDLIGIGLGPFNLGLAALADDVNRPFSFEVQHSKVNVIEHSLGGS